MDLYGWDDEEYLPQNDEYEVFSDVYEDEYQERDKDFDEDEGEFEIKEPDEEEDIREDEVKAFERAAIKGLQTDRRLEDRDSRFEAILGPALDEIGIANRDVYKDEIIAKWPRVTYKNPLAIAYALKIFLSDRSKNDKKIFKEMSVTSGIDITDLFRYYRIFVAINKK